MTLVRLQGRAWVSVEGVQECRGKRGHGEDSSARRRGGRRGGRWASKQATRRLGAELPSLLSTRCPSLLPIWLLLLLLCLLCLLCVLCQHGRVAELAVQLRAGLSGHFARRRAARLRHSNHRVAAGCASAL